jgi:hypothetical protein
MTVSMIPLIGTLGVFWHIVGRGLAIGLGTVWSWILIVSRQRAKAEQILHDWSLKRHTWNLSRPYASSLAQEPAAKTNSAIPSRIIRPAVHRQGF